MNSRRIFSISSTAFCAGLLLYSLYPKVSDYVYKRHTMRTELHPVWKEFDRGRFEAGDSLRELIASHPPQIHWRYGIYSVLGYHDAVPGEIAMSGINVIAKGDKLLRAEVGHETFTHRFFDIITEGELTELNSSDLDEIVNHNTPPNPSGPVR